MVRAATLRCRLIGHKFLGKFETIEGRMKVTRVRPVDFCVRCGATRDSQAPKEGTE